MGKGDIKTKRGKIVKGTFGKHRPHDAKKPAAATTTKATKGKKSK